MSINEFIDGVHQWISMDFQFFEIQFFEETMNKPWKTMEKHETTKSILSVSRDGSWRNQESMRSRGPVISQPGGGGSSEIMKARRSA